VSAAAVEAVRQVGYYAACTTSGGANGKSSDLFTLRRIDAGNGRLSRLAVRARVAGFDLGFIRRWFRPTRPRATAHRLPEPEHVGVAE
jgi:hypothetical protein